MACVLKTGWGNQIALSWKGRWILSKKSGGGWGERELRD